jgi:L-lactate dehydrogenase complex protein LldG
MSAREEVLGRIRRAVADRPNVAAVPRDYLGAGDLVVDDVLALFAERVAGYRADVQRCSTDELPAVIAARIALRGLHSLVVPDGLDEAWLASVAESVQRCRPPLDADALDGIGGVVTTAACGVALTGTIVLDHGPGQGARALTLVPDYHLIVILADQVVAGVPDAIARLGASGPLTWISGPSATSDIELDRVEGVHGPRTLDVILVA